MLSQINRRFALSAEERRRLIFCLLISSLWMLIAHAYIFFQDAFSHDSLNAIFADDAENQWKMSLGRILKPLYQDLFRGALALPWLIGVLSIVWMGLAVWLIIRLFDVRSLPVIALISGLLTTNLTVSATAATYIYDLDANMLAFLLAAAAAWAWHRGGWKSLWAIPALCGCLSLYQSYVSIAILLIMFSSMRALSLGTPVGKVFKKGLQGILLLIAGALCYALALLVCSKLTGISYDTNTYNSLHQMTDVSLPLIGKRLGTAGHAWLDQLLTSSTHSLGESTALVLHLLACACLIFCLLIPVFKRKISLLSALLFVLLVLLIPGVIYFSFLFSNVSHLLTLPGLWLLYPGALILTLPAPDKTTNRSIQAGRVLLCAALAVILWGNVRTANSIYLKKDLEQDAALSLMTRVTYRMETHEDYIPNETPVAFIGVSSLTKGAPGFAPFTSITGIASQGASIQLDTSPLASYHPYLKYYQYVLGLPIRTCSDADLLRLREDPRVKAMPAYPAQGCMGLVDDIFVVKMN